MTDMNEVTRQLAAITGNLAKAQENIDACNAGLATQRCYNCHVGFPAEYVAIIDDLDNFWCHDCWGDTNRDMETDR